NTGFISGIPRASGNFTARATVSNAIGSAIPVSSPLKVLPLVAAASGQYVAQVAPSQPLNNNLGGRLDVILTDNSAYTAALQLAGETFRAVGAFNLNAVSSDYGAGVYESIITFNRPNRKAIRALLFIYTSSGELEGFVSDQVNSTKLYGYRHSWDAKFRSGPFIDYPFAAATGSYKTSLRFNVGLEPEAARIGQTDTPEGGGYLALTMTNGGVATLAGRLADGTSVTSGTLVSLSAQLYVFQAINLNTSSLGGFISLATPLSGDLRWTKGRQPISERIYQPGFSPTTLKAFGSIYFAPAVNTNALQVSEIDKNARINFTRGGLTSTDPNLSIRVSPKNAVTYPTTNPAKVALTINPSTGLICHPIWPCQHERHLHHQSAEFSECRHRQQCHLEC
ncbi:MAG: hypothetical protein NTV80_03265, partial [Verrucomicrobia bacterium]|nr:hypothetical protein [Verrucomicrobiota bacterium]